MHERRDMTDRTDEQKTNPTSSTTQSIARGVVAAGPTRAIESVSRQGKTSIADSVVAKIAGLAAREIEGVHDLVATGAGAALSGLATRVAGGSAHAMGVNVEVGQREAAVDLNMIADYGVSIPQVADAVRQNIIDRLAAMTGLEVKEVNIVVSDLYFPQESETRPQSTRVQ
jgi:uncharacterized alkaline shock family protein YloU